MPAPRLVAVVIATGALLAPAAALAQQEPGPPHATNLVVGEAPPTVFALESIDGVTHELASELGERPLLLLFFRGTW